MIRLATTDDVPALVTLGVRFLHETPYHMHLAVSPTHLEEVARALLASTDAVIFVAERHGEVVGCLALHVFLHPMSGERTANELVWWVNPEARGVGVLLLRRGEEWAKAMQATRMQMVAPTAAPEVARFYTHAGFAPVETMFERRIA